MVRPNYKTNDPKGWCGDPKRGAAMGRNNRHLSDELAAEFPGKLTLRRIDLDAGGYDSNGTYFGSGPECLPLYWYASDDGAIDCVVRANDRLEAKALALSRYPKARFFR